MNSKQSKGKHYYRTGIKTRHTSCFWRNSVWTQYQGRCVSTKLTKGSRKGQSIAMNKKQFMFGHLILYLQFRNLLNTVCICHQDIEWTDIYLLAGFLAARSKPLLLSSRFPSTEWEARDSHWIEITNLSEWGILRHFNIFLNAQNLHDPSILP